MNESAHLLLAEHDAINPWWCPGSDSAGAATLVQQFSEATENLLRRIFKRAQDLRNSGYQLDAAYFVLGRDDAAPSDSRLTVARCLQSVLDPRTGVLHLVTASPRSHLVAFQLADHLREVGSARRLELHFPEYARPDPALSRPTPSRGETARLLYVS